MAMITNEQLAQQHRNEQRNQVSLDYAILTLLFRFFGWIVRKLWMVRATVLWSLALIFAISTGEIGMLIAVIVGLVALTALGIFWNSAILRLLPFAGDYLRYKSKKEAYEAWYNGAKMLVRMGVMSEDVAATIPIGGVSMTAIENGDKIVWELRNALDGIPSGALISRAQEYKHLLNAVTVTGGITNNGGVRVVFHMTNPLDKVQQRDKPARLDPQKMSVECAVDSMGETATITFGDASGMVVGGVPGSGKSAGVTSFLLPLALSPYVDLSIIDGKGGEDWSHYESRSARYIRGDENLEPIRDFLREFHDKMIDRLEGQKQLLGESNFWNVPADKRRAAGQNFQLLVIDECQGIFEKAGRSKEEQAILGEIYRYASILVKRGRSAGFFVIFMTQKPTSDSLPSTIQSNCGLRVSFRVTTAAAATSILGEMPDDATNDLRPTHIPASRKGGAILATDEGDLMPVRFLYVDEKTQTELLGG